MLTECYLTSAHKRSKFLDDEPFMTETNGIPFVSVAVYLGAFSSAFLEDVTFQVDILPSLHLTRHERCLNLDAVVVSSCVLLLKSHFVVSDLSPRFTSKSCTSSAVSECYV